MLRLAADGGVSREGLFSRDRLLSARAAYIHTCAHKKLLFSRKIIYKKEKKRSLITKVKDHHKMMSGNDASTTTVM